MGGRKCKSGSGGGVRVRFCKVLIKGGLVKELIRKIG
jgi:hypothetical protein